MRRLYLSSLGILLGLLVAAPAGFSAQQQSQTPTTGQQPAATAPAQSSPTADQQQPAQDQSGASDEDQTVKGVKAGSEKDVNSIGNRDVGKGVNLYSLQREIALGKQAAMEVEKTAKMINDPVVTEYVNRVGQNLVRNSDAKVPFTIKVIDSDEVNAFALPGGFFFVNSGLILKADSEAELAGVMAHEIAHVAARHGTRQATRGEVAQLAMIPLIIMTYGTWTGYGIYEAASILVPIGFLKFSRGFESEADMLGLE